MLDQIGQGGLSDSVSALARALSEAGGNAQQAARLFGALSGGAVDLAVALAPVASAYALLRFNAFFAAQATRAVAGASNLASRSFVVTTRRLYALARGGRAAPAAMHGLRRAMTLLGGPFGIALLAAEGLAFYALSAGEAAHEAERRTRREFRGESLDARLAEIERARARLKDDLRRFREGIVKINAEALTKEGDFAFPTGTPSDIERRATKAALEIHGRAEERIAQLTLDRIAHVRRAEAAQCGRAQPSARARRRRRGGYRGHDPGGAQGRAHRDRGDLQGRR